jgi:mannosyltransferase OCH1-like enzyme
MRYRVYLFLFSVIIILFLLWQLVLIIETIHDVLIGIETTSFDIKLNKANRSIPRIIHQMWKTTNLLTYPINTSHNEWKKFYPDYKINLWTDKQIEELILKEEYKYLYSIYKSYSYAIQRADLARLIILHNDGGIYADLDVHPCSTNIEELRVKDASLIIPRSSSDICLINHFIMSEQHSDILDYILHQIQSKSFLKQIIILPYLEVFSTGSIFLTNIIRKRIKIINPNDDRLIILSKDQLSKYIDHGIGRSWHLFDGYLINQIDANPKRFFICFIFFIFFVFSIVKFRTLFRILSRLKT